MQQDNASGLTIFIGALLATLSWVCLSSTAGMAQHVNPGSKYGLQVIADWQAYEQKGLSASQRLVPLDNYLLPFFQDIRYATPNNFTGVVLYHRHSLWLTLKAAKQLRLVQDSLLKRGLNLLIYDAYRPYSTTVAMWEKVPDNRYAANPAQGSGHNRGIALDLTMAAAETGEPVAMPTGYDSFSDTAHYAFTALPSHILSNRSILRGVMEHFGFNALSTEWWHFSLPNSRAYPLLDLSFQTLEDHHRH